MYFPAFFNDEDTMEFYQHIKAKIQAIADTVTGQNTEAAERKLQEIDKYILQQAKPQDFDMDSPNNVAIRSDVQFETLCSVLEGNGVVNAGDLTLVQFYARLEHFKRANQPHRKP